VQRSTAGSGAAKKKDPVLFERMPALLLALGDDLPGRRDRALLLLGYAGAFRRSELVALDVGDEGGAVRRRGS
jgi:integrase